MSKNFQELSRVGYCPSMEDGVEHKTTVEDIKLGALLRIADALEKYDILELEKKAGELRKENEELSRSIHTRRGVESDLRLKRCQFEREINGLKGCVAYLNKCIDRKMAKIKKKEAK